MPKAAANGLQLEYETFGDDLDVPVILIMGLGAQLVSWDEGFCEALASRGCYVIRFDNRDIGKSTWFDEAGEPDWVAIMGGDNSGVAYTLFDMAQDSIGLLDSLHLDTAHIVGVSMGAMIGQIMCAEYPSRISSFTQISSTTGAMDVGQTDPAVIAALLKPTPLEHDAYIAHELALRELIGSPEPMFDPERAKEKAEATFVRGPHPEGSTRQLAATLATGDRSTLIAMIKTPTVVLHGDADKFLDISGGRATAALIPDAEFDVIEGMGHDLPVPMWARIIESIVRNIQRATI